MNNNGNHFIKTSWPDSLYEQVYDHVEWQRPHLRALTEGITDKREAVLLLIAHLRQRKMPTTGYSAEYYQRLSNQASSVDRQQARGRIEHALTWDFLMPYHRNTFCVLGAETIYLGLDAKLCRRIA